MKEKTYQTRCGTIHYWASVSNPDAITLVFLPGLTADHRLFDKQIQYFENKHNVVVWDAPAHASSWPFRFDFDLFDKAKWLNDILNQDKIAKPVIVGQSMGGHNAGDYASSHAVSVVVEEIRQDQDFNPVKVIRHAIESANIEIIEQAQKDEKLKGMGTTMVVSTIVGQYAYVANVGDSRLYVADRELQQITRDHSLVQEMVRMGEISAEEARNHPDKNIITRALGAERTVDVDFFDLKLEPESVILMCSDGLSNMVEDSRIKEILSRRDEALDERGRTLIGEANRNGGKDNIAIVLIEPFANEVEEC